MQAATQATVTCPRCDHKSKADMPLDACLWFYECPACHVVLTPQPGDRCVFCSYGDMQCPPKQEEKSCCSKE